MSHFQGEQQRPVMRRKSSAQNLLSSFMPSNTSAGPAVPAPISIGPPNPAPSTAMSFISAVNGGSNGTRELDAQSLHSDTVAASLGGATSPQLGQGTTVEYLRDLVQKRIITLTYIRNIHEGRSHWFHTILITRAELDKVFNNFDMKKRTHRFAILGLSLSSLLDIHQPQDLLRGLINTISEYELAKEDGDKPRIRPPKRLFKSKLKRGVSGVAEYTGSYTEPITDTSYLMTPHMPFPLDYHQTLMSLLDILSEVYNKISILLGPSPFPYSSQHMMGPLGLLSPHPGVSYLFSGENNSNTLSSPNHQSNPNLPTISSSIEATSETDLNGSLYGIANAAGAVASGGIAGAIMYGGGLNSPPITSWTNSLGEMLLKVDGKLKKITTTLLNDLDTFARNGIRDELASLDPLLRNMSVTDDGSNMAGGKIVYDFEGMHKDFGFVDHSYFRDARIVSDTRKSVSSEVALSTALYFALQLIARETSIKVLLVGVGS